jgi:hypothetical protein
MRPALLPPLRPRRPQHSTPAGPVEQRRRDASDVYADDIGDGAAAALSEARDQAAVYLAGEGGAAVDEAGVRLHQISPRAQELPDARQRRAAPRYLPHG